MKKPVFPIKRSSSWETREEVSVSPFAGKSEEELWDAFRKGQEGAFEHLYQKFFPILFNYAHQFTTDRELVKDTIQDLFIDLGQKRQRLGGTTSIKFYLFKSIRRKLVRAGTSGFSRFFLNTDNLPEHAFEIELSPEAHLINRQWGVESVGRLNQAIRQLSARQREILIYYYYEGLSYREITELMGFSRPEYARVLMSRTIARLKELLPGSQADYLLALLVLQLLPE